MVSYGYRVAEYDIGDKLGEGQFAIVYKCMKRRGTPGGPLETETP
jgi:hypothetical protein